MLLISRCPKSREGRDNIFRVLLVQGILSKLARFTTSCLCYDTGRRITMVNRFVSFSNSRVIVWRGAAKPLYSRSIEVRKILVPESLGEWV